MDVIGVGNIVTDLLVQIEQRPRDNSRADIKNYSWQGGGMVTNALSVLSIFGAKAGMMGVVGDDSFGETCIEDLKRYGVNTDHILMEAGKRSIFSVVVSVSSNATRNILNYPGTVDLRFEKLDPVFLTSGKIVHVATNKQYAKDIAAYAAAHGVKVSLDGDQFTMEDLPMLRNVDFFVACEECYERLFPAGGDYETNLKKLRACGPSVVVVTLGDRGAVGYDGNEFVSVPAFSVAVVDTTGAGDVFHGAFLYGILQNWNLERNLRFSSATSALKCLSPGGRIGIPTLDMVERFLAGEAISKEELRELVQSRSL